MALVGLTPREWHMLLLSWHSNKEVGLMLELSAATVKNERSQMYEKVRVLCKARGKMCKARALWLALNNGLIGLDDLIVVPLGVQRETSYRCLSSTQAGLIASESVRRKVRPSTR